MAWMIPPAAPQAGTAHESEIRLYNLMKEHLSNEYVVIHGEARLTVNKKGDPEDGEIDFCVIHRKFGLVFFEVKSGNVKYEPGTREWYYPKGPFGRERLKKDPIAQIRKNHFAIRRQLEESTLTSEACKNGRYQTGYAVWLPDARWKDDVLPFQHGEYLVLDSRYNHDPEQGILRTFNHFQRGQDFEPLNDAELLALITVIEGPIDPKIVGILGKQGPDDDSVVEELTPEQLINVQELCSDEPALKVPGAAGSGKTVIATRVAYHFATHLPANTVLYLVRNQYMAEWLRHRAENDQRYQQAPYDICSLKDLVRKVAERGGLRASQINKHDIETFTGQNALKAILDGNLEALHRRGESMAYEAVIVDDAEDFEQMLWVPFRKLLRNPATGRLRIFYDEAQRMDPSGRLFLMNIPGLSRNVPLTAILRNARPISGKLAEFNYSLRTYEFAGPEGFPIDYIDPTEFSSDRRKGDPLDQALNEAFKRIREAQPNIKLHEIGIITCRSRDSSHWHLAKQRARSDRPLRWINDGQHKDMVTLATIRSAKGLEYKAVILAEFDGVQDGKKRDQLLYVAISRANLHLIVLGTEKDIVVRQARLL